MLSEVNNATMLELLQSDATLAIKIPHQCFNQKSIFMINRTANRHPTLNQYTQHDNTLYEEYNNGGKSMKLNLLSFMAFIIWFVYK